MRQYKKVVFEDFPTTWVTGTEGLTLEGEVISQKTAQVEGKERPLAIIRDDEGKDWTLWLNGVLQGLFRSGGVRIGDFIRVTYLGKKPSPVSRFEFNDYDLEVAER